MITFPRPRRARPSLAHRLPDPDPAAASPAAGRAPGHRAEHALADALVGSRVVVTRILGDEAFRGRLIGLGIAPGVDVTVAAGGPGRPRVLGLTGSRMAIDDRSAGLVLVRPAHASSRGLDA